MGSMPQSAGNNDRPTKTTNGPALASTHTPAVTTNTTSASAGAAARDVVQWRLTATRDWLASQPQTTISIQLMGTHDEEQLKNHLNVLSKFIEINDIFVYRTMAKQKPSMTVLYGSFDDHRAAQEALAKLPPFLKENRPILRTVQGIREEIRLHQSS